MALEVRLDGVARGPAMVVGAADEAVLERVDPAELGRQGQPVLEDVAHHVPRRELVDRHVGGERVERVPGQLLERAELVRGLHALPGQAVVAALGSTFMLDDLGQRLEEGPLARFLRVRRIGKHQPARQIGVVRDGEHVAALLPLQALLAQLLPQPGRVRAIGRDVADRAVDDLLGPKDDVAVHVRELGLGRVLVGDEGGEAAVRAAVVMGLGGILDRLPDRNLGLVAIHALPCRRAAGAAPPRSAAGSG